MDCVTHVTICIFHGNLCTAVNDNVTAALGINSSLPTTATCIQRTRASDCKRSACHINRVTTTANSIVLTDQGDGQIVGCFDTTGTFSCICNIYPVQRQCICIRRVCNSTITKNIALVRAGNLGSADPNVICSTLSQRNVFTRNIPIYLNIFRPYIISIFTSLNSIASLRDPSKAVLTIIVRRRGSYHRRGSVCASCAQLDACTGNEGGSILNRAGHSICCRGSSHVTYITTISILPIDF